MSSISPHILREQVTLPTPAVTGPAAAGNDGSNGGGRGQAGDSSSSSTIAAAPHDHTTSNARTDALAGAAGITVEQERMLDLQRDVHRAQQAQDMFLAIRRARD
jgi:hypothetical protein